MAKMAKKSKMASTGPYRPCGAFFFKIIDTATLGLAGDVTEAFKHNDHTQIQENISILHTHMTYLLDLTVEYDESESNNPMFQLWKWHQYYFTSHVHTGNSYI